MAYDFSQKQLSILENLSIGRRNTGSVMPINPALTASNVLNNQQDQQLQITDQNLAVAKKNAESSEQVANDIAEFLRIQKTELHHKETSLSDSFELLKTSRGMFEEVSRMHSTTEFVVEKIQDLNIAFNPFKQLAMGLRGEFKDVQFERGKGKEARYLKKVTNATFSSDSEVISFTKPVSQLIKAGMGYENTHLSILSSMHTIARFQGQELITIRNLLSKSSGGEVAGSPSNVFVGEYAPNMAEQLSDMVSSVPVINAIGEVAKTAFKVVSPILTPYYTLAKTAQGIKKGLKAIPRALGLSYDKSTAETLKDAGLDVDEKKAAIHFTAIELPKIQEATRTLISQQLDTQRNIYSVLNDTYSFLSGRERDQGKISEGSTEKKYDSLSGEYVDDEQASRLKEARREQLRSSISSNRGFMGSLFRKGQTQEIADKSVDLIDSQYKGDFIEKIEKRKEEREEKRLQAVRKGELFANSALIAAPLLAGGLNSIMVAVQNAMFPTGIEQTAGQAFVSGGSAIGGWAEQLLPFLQSAKSKFATIEAFKLFVAHQSNKGLVKTGGEEDQLSILDGGETEGETASKKKAKRKLFKEDFKEYYETQKHGKVLFSKFDRGFQQFRKEKAAELEKQSADENAEAVTSQTKDTPKILWSDTINTELPEHTRLLGGILDAVKKLNTLEKSETVTEESETSRPMFYSPANDDPDYEYGKTEALPFSIPANDDFIEKQEARATGTYDSTPYADMDESKSTKKTATKKKTITDRLTLSKQRRLDQQELKNEQTQTSLLQQLVDKFDGVFTKGGGDKKEGGGLLSSLLGGLTHGLSSLMGGLTRGLFRGITRLLFSGLTRSVLAPIAGAAAVWAGGLYVVNKLFGDTAEHVTQLFAGTFFGENGLITKFSNSLTSIGRDISDGAIGKNLRSFGSMFASDGVVGSRLVSFANMFSEGGVIRSKLTSFASVFSSDGVIASKIASFTSMFSSDGVIASKIASFAGAFSSEGVIGSKIITASKAIGPVIKLAGKAIAGFGSTVGPLIGKFGKFIPVVGQAITVATSAYDSWKLFNLWQEGKMAAQEAVGSAQRYQSTSINQLKKAKATKAALVKRGASKKEIQRAQDAIDKAQLNVKSASARVDEAKRMQDSGAVGEAYESFEVLDESKASKAANKQWFISYEMKRQGATSALHSMTAKSLQYKAQLKLTHVFKQYDAQFLTIKARITKARNEGLLGKGMQLIGAHDSALDLIEKREAIKKRFNKEWSGLAAKVANAKASDSDIIVKYKTTKTEVAKLKKKLAGQKASLADQIESADARNVPENKRTGINITKAAIAKTEQKLADDIKIVSQLKPKIPVTSPVTPKKVIASTKPTSTSPSIPSLNKNIDEIVIDASKKNNVDPNLIRKIIQAESSGNPNAVSPRHAAGLMQLTPATAQELGVTDPFDPEQNVNGGALYISRLLGRYNGDVPHALAAYNWGMGNLDRHGIQNAPKETRDYVRKIAGVDITKLNDQPKSHKVVKKHHVQKPRVASVKPKNQTTGIMSDVFGFVSEKANNAIDLAGAVTTNAVAAGRNIAGSNAGKFVKAKATNAIDLAGAAVTNATVAGRNIAGSTAGDFIKSKATNAIDLAGAAVTNATVAGRNIAGSNAGKFVKSKATNAIDLAGAAVTNATVAGRNIAGSTAGDFIKSKATNAIDLAGAAVTNATVAGRNIAGSNAGKFVKAKATNAIDLAGAAVTNATVAGRNIAGSNAGKFVKAKATNAIDLASAAVTNATVAGRNIAGSITTTTSQLLHPGERASSASAIRQKAFEKKWKRPADNSNYGVKLKAERNLHTMRKFGFSMNPDMLNFLSSMQARRNTPDTTSVTPVGKRDVTNHSNSNLAITAMSKPNDIRTSMLNGIVVSGPQAKHVAAIRQKAFEKKWKRPADNSNYGVKLKAERDLHTLRRSGFSMNPDMLSFLSSMQARRNTTQVASISNSKLIPSTDRSNNIIEHSPILPSVVNIPLKHNLPKAAIVRSIHHDRKPINPLNRESKSSNIFEKNWKAPSKKDSARTRAMAVMSLRRYKGSGHTLTPDMESFLNSRKEIRVPREINSGVNLKMSNSYTPKMGSSNIGRISDKQVISKSLETKEVARNVELPGAAELTSALLTNAQVVAETAKVYASNAQSPAPQMIQQPQQSSKDIQLDSTTSGILHNLFAATPNAVQTNAIDFSGIQKLHTTGG